MPPPRWLLAATLLFLAPFPTLQVDIVLEWRSATLSYFDILITARCDDIPPGTCCKPEREVLPFTTNHRAGLIVFRHLLPQQFGAGWGASGPTHSSISCTGPPISRVFGTGEEEIYIHNPPWEEGIKGTPETVVFAASWVDLRTRFPPDSEGSRYLQWQGVKGAVWGTGTWSAASGGVPFPKAKDKRENIGMRLNGWADKGTVTVQTPTRWVSPAVYTVKGTEYWRTGNGSYVSRDGKALVL